LLREVGEAVFSLNTTVVGLDAVENGYEKPESLDISWNPIDRRIAARKTRKFVLESVLIHVSEALNQYISALSGLPRFVDIREAWAMPKADDSAAKKLTDVAFALLGRENYRIAGAVLLVHWRNRIVHKASRARLAGPLKRLLQENETQIALDYKSLSIDCLFCHFEEGRPSLKDVSSLIAMTIKLAKEMDKQIYECFSREDLQVWLDYYNLLPQLEKVSSETKAEKLQESIKRVFSTNAPQLYDYYIRFGRVKKGDD